MAQVVRYEVKDCTLIFNINVTVPGGRGAVQSARVSYHVTECHLLIEGSELT